MRKSLFILVFLILILSACSGDAKEYKFYGDSNNWLVKYETEISKEREWADYSIEYIGEDPVPEVFNYTIKSSWFEFGTNEEKLNEEDKVHSGNSECTGPPQNDESCEASISKNEKIKAILDWFGESEVIELQIN